MCEKGRSLGVDEIHYLPFTDLNVPFNLESVSELEKLIKEYEIDTIYTHWAGDSNQDHIATFRTTMAAGDMFQMYIVMNKYQFQDNQKIQ